jgi:uncharacterized membrane protein (DUF106 family)
MSDGLAKLAAWLNALASLVGGVLLAPIGVLPGWLSATLVAALTGVLLLIVFKYTSNQRAIKTVRDDIKAHLLALKLFKDSTRVTFQAQGRIFLGAGRLFFLAVVPMLIMAIPVTLLLGQLALWYQARPLRVGEQAVMTLKLSGDANAAWPDVRLDPADVAEVTVGPVRVLSKHEVCWEIKARNAGYHRLLLRVDGQTVEKELAVGDGFMRVSKQRPGWNVGDILLHPWETPFGPDSPVQSIEIDYPDRPSRIHGTDWWVAYWFVVSFVAALFFRRWLNVNV